ncbi:hypothetical protein AVEN_262994-1 [Araneus ventricosus]|uniref:Uncharacterized protein n=1 Tax=Araneus ventricosus TaxID=182803 RepID=A0A4Y2WPZ6_ARAVE|nr:hypothetical protein AVEN_262994-1 [Araneus ventricosus]
MQLLSSYYFLCIYTKGFYRAVDQQDLPQSAFPPIIKLETKGRKRGLRIPRTDDPPFLLPRPNDFGDKRKSFGRRKYPKSSPDDTQSGRPLTPGGDPIRTDHKK